MFLWLCNVMLRGIKLLKCSTCLYSFNVELAPRPKRRNAAYGYCCKEPVFYATSKKSLSTCNDTFLAEMYTDELQQTLNLYH